MGTDNLFHKRKRNDTSFKRRSDQKAPYETINIICEGKTEFHYFKKLVRALGLNSANIIVVPNDVGSAPISIAECAFAQAAQFSDIDLIVCVFDRSKNTQSTYHQAVDQLKKHKPKKGDKSNPRYWAIISDPCFEIWIYLHFSYTTKGYTHLGNKSADDHIFSDLKKLFPKYTKLPQAIENAAKLSKHNVSTDSTNPHTDMHELLNYLMELKK